MKFEDKIHKPTNKIELKQISGMLNVVEYLIMKGANITTEDNNGQTAQELASKNGNWKQTLHNRINQICIIENEFIC